MNTSTITEKATVHPAGTPIRPIVYISAPADLPADPTLAFHRGIETALSVIAAGEFTPRQADGTRDPAGQLDELCLLVQAALTSWREAVHGGAPARDLALPMMRLWGYLTQRPPVKRRRAGPAPPANVIPFRPAAR